MKVNHNTGNGISNFKFSDPPDSALAVHGFAAFLLLSDKTISCKEET